jgi:hypothetical protein
MTLCLPADRVSAGADPRSRGSLKRPLRGRRYVMTEMLLPSRTREVVIGIERPFVVIGES